MTGNQRGGFRTLALGLVVVASLALPACGGQGRAPTGTPTATIPAKWRTTLTPSPQDTPPALRPPYSFSASWQKPQGLQANVSGFAFAASDPKIGYACTAQALAQSGAAAGADACYGTADGGQSWHLLPSGPVSSGQYLSVTVDQSDPHDVFLAGMVPWPTNPGQTTYMLWRSRDAGATWAKLGQPNTGYPLALDGVAVVGTRIVVSVHVNGEGALPNSLFASDDDGASWQPFGTNLGGQDVNATSMAAFGTTLLVTAQSMGTPGAMAFRVPASACGPTETPTPVSWRPGIACGNTSGTPTPTTYWRTGDGGHTWAQVHGPGSMPIFTRGANESSYYGISVVFLDGDPTVLYWTRDAGATWTALPTLKGVEGGYLDAALVGSDGQVAVAPDGTVFVGTWHDPIGTNEGGMAGIFTLRPADPAPKWQPLAPGVQALPAGWQAVSGPHGARLWAVADTLMYVDVP